MDWVTKGTEPPASIYPTLASGALITPAAYDRAFPKIAGVPRPAWSPTYQYDLGKSFNSVDMTGVIDRGAAAHHQGRAATDAAHRCRRQ